MRRYIFLFAMLSLFVIGCSEQSSVLAPVNDVNTTEPNWIALPQAKGMHVNTQYTDSRPWDGKKSGTSVSINQSYSGGPFGTVTMSGSLSVDKNCYSGTRTISMTLETNSTVATFGPAQVFTAPLRYNVTYTGLDLSGINPSSVKFAYLGADGSVQYALHEGIKVELSTGTLSVKNAKIPHFSRYGFVN